MRLSHCLTFGLLLTLSLVLRAAPENEVDGERALATVKILADDSFGGRKSGLASGRTAEDWVAARLREFGLRPGNGESYFHELRATVTEELPTPVLRVKLAEKTWRVAGYGKDYVTLTYSGGGEVEGGVVFVGYGIHAPDRGRDDYAGLDVTGKIVMALRGQPTGGAFHEERQIGYKSSTAFDRGAVGFLLVEGDAASSGTIQEKFLRDKLPAVWLSRATADALFQQAGRPNLAQQVATLEAGTAASFPLPNVHVGLTIRTRVHRDAPMRNVVALWPGETDEVVVLGAHLDHLGVGGDGTVMNGADDNASGSAMLLEVARAVAATGRKFRRGILFVWFAGEEQGLLGSNAFVANPPVPARKIAVMLNADMVGQGRPEITIRGVGTFPRVTGYLGNFEVPDVAVRRGFRSGGGSDHAPFARRGIPAFFLNTRGPHPNYHTPRDDWPAIRPELLQLSGRFMRVIAERAAASDAPFCGPHRFPEYLWHDATVFDLHSSGVAPRGMGIDLRLHWTDGDVNEIDSVLTTFEAKGAVEALLPPGGDPGTLIWRGRPGVLLGLRGAAATRLHRPAHRLGVTAFAPFAGDDPATDADALFAFVGTRPAIVILDGASEALDPKSIPAPILLPAALARKWQGRLRERQRSWLVVHRLAPLVENKPNVHAEVATTIFGLVKEFGADHVLVTPGDAADPSYSAQAPTLHPGIVHALLERGVKDDQIRQVLGGNLVRDLRSIASPTNR